jgi:predicted metal-dependent hydrolase
LLSPHKLNWPPEFTLKKSVRARHVRLKASVQHGLELVVPMRFNQKRIPEILEVNKLWIEKQLDKIQQERKDIEAATLPAEIIFPVTGQSWKINYIQSDNKKLQILMRPQQELVLLGNISNKDVCKKLLLSWTLNQAKIYLPLVLQELSEQTRLPFKTVSIRNQRSRWGSCSSEKMINLNYKLLFLPAHLARHIIIHELCHTVHMNHSSKFWRLVSTFDCDWKSNSQDTRRAEKYIPLWATGA